jgi:hypothetical protein
VVLPRLSCSCRESCLLVLWCAGDKCRMAGSDKDYHRRRRPGAEDRGWSSIGWVLGGRMIERSGDTVYDFLVWPQNRLLRVFRFGPQNQQVRFGDYGPKITVMVSWFEPQNHASYGLSVVPQNQWRMKMAWDMHRDLVACFAWKQVGLAFPSLASRLADV